MKAVEITVKGTEAMDRMFGFMYINKIVGEYNKVGRKNAMSFLVPLTDGVDYIIGRNTVKFTAPTEDTIELNHKTEIASFRIMGCEE